MAMRVNDGVEPIKSPPGTDRDGSRPKPPKAVAHRDSLEATRSVPDHKKAKRRLTVKTVALGLPRPSSQAVQQPPEAAATGSPRSARDH